MIIDLYASTRRKCTGQSIGTWVFSAVYQIGTPTNLRTNSTYPSATDRALESKAFQANPSTNLTNTI